jgi:hypothetical protein
MKKIAIRVCVTILLIGFSTVALNARGVFNAKITPDEILVGSNQTVTITAEITGNGLYLSSVSLFQTTSNGQPITNLGPLYDDGSHGDAVPADTIFTTQLQLKPQSTQQVYFRISAAFQGDRNRYLSQVITNTAYSLLRDGIVADTVLALQNLTTNYFEYLTSNTVSQARLLALADAQNNPSITSAFLSENDLCIIYEGTIHGMAYLSDPNSSPTLANNEYPSVDGLEIFASWYTGHCTGPWYWPFNNDCWGITANADYASTRFGSATGMQFTPSPPSIDKDSLASLDTIKHWGDNAAVVVTTHGGLWSNPNDPNDNNGYVVLRTGVEATPDAQHLYNDDLRASPPRLGLDTAGRIDVYPAYISKYCRPMKNTFFYLGACHSLQNDSLWNALQALGAKVAFGWSDEVFTAFDSQTFTSLINLMVPNDQTQPSTAQQAFDSIANKCDSHTSPACLWMRFALPDWNNFIFSQGGLVNGDFETGDWTGWTHGGDFDSYANVVSAEKHGGQFAAGIGRWDSAYNGNNPTLEPFGTEYFYQDCVVPNNVTQLRFDWWQEGYDTANWDWFDAYIMDTNGNVLQTLMYHGGKPGLNYGPYWNTSSLTPVSYPSGSPGIAVGGGWYEVIADVSAYRGQKIRIYFDQRLDGFGDQTRTYIDDVRLVQPIFQE